MKKIFSTNKKHLLSSVPFQRMSSAATPDTTSKVINFYSHREYRYGCFSNFSAHHVFLRDFKWPTSEHYFQAMKFEHSDKDFHHVMYAPSPGKAAEAGRDRSRPLRRDWEGVKDKIMFDVVLAKFSQNKELKGILLGTGDAVLVEHTVRDSYWGDGGDGSGKNMLGHTLMAVRDVIRKMETADGSTASAQDVANGKKSKDADGEVDNNSNSAKKNDASSSQEAVAKRMGLPLFFPKDAEANDRSASSSVQFTFSGPSSTSSFDAPATAAVVAGPYTRFLQLPFFQKTSTSPIEDVVMICFSVDQINWKLFRETNKEEKKLFGCATEACFAAFVAPASSSIASSSTTPKDVAQAVVVYSTEQGFSFKDVTKLQEAAAARAKGGERAEVDSANLLMIRASQLCRVTTPDRSQSGDSLQNGGEKKKKKNRLQH